MATSENPKDAGAISSSARNTNNSSMSANILPRDRVDSSMVVREVSGILEVNSRDGRGVIRPEIRPSEMDVIVSQSQVRGFRLRPGDLITAEVRRPRDRDVYWSLIKVNKINGEDPAKMMDRVKFERGTPIYPYEKIALET